MPDQQENEGWQEAVQRIEKVKRSNLTLLDLNSLSLTTVPESVGQLTDLVNLDLKDNQLTAIPESVSHLPKLEFLDVRNNQLTSIPESLSQLPHLTHLYLGDNQFTVIPEILSQLTKLNSLDLSSNQIIAIPESLCKLTNLQDLYLYNNQIHVIPESLGQLSELQNLYLALNRISAVPSALSQLTDLQSLHLGSNLIATIPESLAHLSKLTRLHLDNNRLLGIPNSFGQLTNLEYLSLNDNKLTFVPKFLAELSKLSTLFLHGNPGLRIPAEILGPTSAEVFKGKDPKPPREILEYVFSKSRPLNEAKLILVGQGGVGKTSLVKTLTGQKFKKGEKTTQGIKIKDWSCPLNRKNTDNITVHIWDFGGQEMMHATHQFFLTARSLYLLVLNWRPGAIDREADYWFRLVRASGGKDAPVIVVLNKQKSEPFDVNRGGWLEKYAGNIKGFVETDCEDAKSIARLKKKIQEELQEMKSLKASFPERWFAIKDELSQMSDQYLTYERYREICKERGEENPEQQTSLAGFLHDLGVALNYKDDPRLRFAYVLKPEWVTEGIYALLHAFVKNKGLFTRNEAVRVLDPKGYKAEAVDFILGLMDQFEVSFPMGDNQKRSMIPQLLDDQQPNEARQFNPTECLNFGYKYEIVPEGLLPRFIVRTHHISEVPGRWKSGVILHDVASGCRALVRADSTAGLVSIHVDGPEQARRELLAIIRYNFRVIHADYEFKPTELVYPQGVPERPLLLDDLEAFLRSNAASTIPIKLPNEKVITPTVASLMEPVKETGEPLRLFLSYAHSDEKYVNELRKDLKLMERNGFIRSWYDRALTAGEKWEARILQELNEADVIVCQISRDFLNSDFCVLTELDRAIRRKEAGEAELVAYLLEHCGWKEVPRLASFQALPRDAKPLSEWKGKQDKYWRAVAEGIQDVIKKLRQQRPLRPSRGLGVDKIR